MVLRITLNSYKQRKENIMLKQIIIALFILSLTVSTSFAAESFECQAHSAGHGFSKGGTVSIGQLKGEVITKCGVPEFCEVISNNPKVEVCSFYGDLNLDLTFKNGKLSKIEKVKEKKK